MKYLCLALCLVALFACTSVVADVKLQAMYEKLFNPNGSFSTQLTDDLCKLDDIDFNKYSGDDWKGTDPTNPQYIYTLSFCKAAAESNCALKEGSLCQYDTKQSDEFSGSLASFVSTPAPTVTYADAEKKEGLQLTFTNGEQCFDKFLPRDRTTVINFSCDEGVDAREFTIVEEPTCYYTAHIRSKVACSGSGLAGGLSGGAWFLIIVLIIAVVYVIAGCLICVFAFRKPFGLQSFPHHAFWFALPGLFVAGCGFTIGKIKGCFGSKTITTTSGDYEEA